MTPELAYLILSCIISAAAGAVITSTLIWKRATAQLNELLNENAELNAELDRLNNGEDPDGWCEGIVWNEPDWSIPASWCNPDHPSHGHDT